MYVILRAITSVVAFPLMKMDWKKLEDECIFDSIDKSFFKRALNRLSEEPFFFLNIRLDNSLVFYKFEK